MRFLHSARPAGRQKTDKPVIFPFFRGKRLFSGSTVSSGAEHFQSGKILALLYIKETGKTIDKIVFYGQN
jgi:hypothetical protein